MPLLTPAELKAFADTLPEDLDTLDVELADQQEEALLRRFSLSDAGKSAEALEARHDELNAEWRRNIISDERLRRKFA